MPPTPLQITFQVNNLNAVAAAANRAATAFQNLAGASQAANANLPGRGAGGAGRGGGTPRTPKPPPSFGKRIQAALMSSRFGVGAGGGLSLFPLVSGIAKAFGPLGIVVLGVTAAIQAEIEAVKAMTQAAVESAETLRSIAFATGSQGTNLGSLRGIFGKGAGGLSSNLQSHITGNGMSQAFAASMGIFNMPRPFGGVDEGENLLKAVEKLRQIPDFKERLRGARLLGLDDEAAQRALTLSPEQYAKSKKRGQFNESLFGDQKTQQNVADFTQALSDVKDAGMNILGALGKSVLPQLTGFMNHLADWLNSIADFVNKHQNTFSFGSKMVLGFLDFLIDVSTKLMNLANQWLPDLPDSWGSGTGNNPHADALDSNTRATIETTQQLERLNQLLPGVFGRSERAGSALPGSLAPGSGPPTMNNNDLRNFRLSPI